MRKPELLAPVGSWEALLAALANGADAVYMGGKQFSARAYASNFDEGEMERAVQLTHRFGAKVFVTVNTLLRGDELETMAPYLRQLYNTGVDALIVQDFGLLHNLRALIPSMELHASTQMTVHNTEGARLMKELGISRVVLARELTFEQVKQITVDSGVEIETFIHGALCFAYSGQCLMSSIIGGRSGNRGRCAQPCRLPYDLVKRGQVINAVANRHQLSPRDMNQLHYLQGWIKAGISALKIEGRMKRPEYVATVVGTYRRALDAILEGRLDGVTAEDDDALLSVFNRQFTPGFAFAPKGPDLMSMDRPDNRGVQVGEILSYGEDRRSVKARVTASVSTEDQLELWSPGYNRLSARVSRDLSPGQTAWLQTEDALTGQKAVYRTADAGLNKKALDSYSDWQELANQHRVRLDLSLRIASGEPVAVSARTADGRSIQLSSEFVAEPAQNRPITADLVQRAMVKLVDTPFVLGECHVEIVNNPSVPISLLNRLRKQIVEGLDVYEGRPHLEEEWEGRWPLTLLDKDQAVGRKAPLKLVVAVGDRDSAEEALASRPDIVVLGGESYAGAATLEDYLFVAEKARQQGTGLVAALPRITTDEQLAGFQPLLTECEQRGIPVQVANLGQLHLALKQFPGLRLNLHWSLNLFNAWSVSALLRPQVVVLMPSPELTLGQIEELKLASDYDVAVTVGGRLTLMISEHCIRRNADTGECQRCGGESLQLRDRYGAEFPVYRDQYCRSHVLNSQDLCLVEHLYALERAGINQLIVEGRGYTQADLHSVLMIWKQALTDYTIDPREWKERGRRYRMELEKFSPGGITKGHFFRGVE
ncbi:MAG: DUF3656 domain-containing U32 family peptidase [Bacillota bacterium]